MLRTQLYLPDSEYDELKKLARASGRTFASLAREFLGEKLQEAKLRKKTKSKNAVSEILKSLKKINKLKESGVTRKGSVDHDSYLYGEFMKNG